MKQIVVISLCVFFSLMLVMYLFQRSFMYFPDNNLPLTKEFHAQDMQVVSLIGDGLILHSWYKPAPLNRPTILYLHGNAGHIGYRMPLARNLINAGFGLFLLEYRGFGGNKGRSNEQGLYEDGRLALKFLQQQGVKISQVILYGESLGTAVATKLATEEPVCALILQTPFTSFVHLARYHYPWLPFKPWDRFDSLDRMSEIHSALLVLHGKNDLVVPYEQGLAIFESAKQPKKMISYENKGHNNLWDHQFFSDVIQFINEHCPENKS